MQRPRTLVSRPPPFLALSCCRRMQAASSRLHCPKMTDESAKARSTRALLSVTSLLFGVSAWVSINGLWVEMPLLVPRLPEGWNLGAIVVIVIQAANLGPLVYTLAHKRIPTRAAIHLTLFVGLSAGVLLVFFWQVTAGSHSVAFIALVAFMALVDCTSSVLYMPFMARYPHRYLFWYMVGEGLSGLLPAGLALLQGVGGGDNCSSVITNSTTDVVPASEPRFSVEVFLALLSTIMALSWASFAVLAHLPAAVKHQVANKGSDSHPPKRYGSTDNLGFVADSSAIPARQSESQQIGGTVLPATELHREEVRTPPNPGHMATIEWATMLGMQCFIGALCNGVLPAVQTYTSLPYGQMPYHLATNLATVANPVACAVAGVLQLQKLAGLIALAVAGCVCAAYLLVLAALSPDPPLVHSVAGSAMMVLAWVLFVSLETYVKTRLASRLMDHGGAQSLLWYGAATQGGSFAGALIMFLLTTFTNSFTAAKQSC